MDLSISLIDSIKDPEWYAGYYNAIGIIENSVGNFEKAFDSYVKASEIYEVLNDSGGIAATNLNIGGIYDHMNLDQKALDLYNLALDYYKLKNDDDGISGILNNIGEIHYGNRDYELALEQYLEALNYAKRNPEEAGQAIPLHNIGRTYQKLGNYSKAVSYLTKSKQINTKIEDFEGLAYDYFELGEVYRSLMNYGLAEKHYLNSLSYARDLNIKTVITDNLKTLGQLYRSLNKYKKALGFQESYELYKDSLFNEQNTKAMTEMQFAFEIEKQEKQIELLTLNNKSTVLSNEKDTIILSFSLLALIFLIVVAIILISQSRIKKKSNNELKMFNEKIYDQNNNLRHYNERLKYSQAQLYELNATKDKFFSIISHDLRSPLNSLSGLLQILMKNAEVFTIDELIQYGKKINESVINLTNLLENLLQWSNSQMGKVEFVPVKLNIYQEIDFIVKLNKLTIEQKEIEVILDFDQDMTVKADKNMFNFIIRNLLSNALKFTMKRGKVMIIVVAEPTEIKISIEDNGVGIHPDNIDKLFALNHHYTTLGTQKEKGTGLGLILINEFIKKHSGRINVESKFEKGTRFDIFFPRS